MADRFFYNKVYLYNIKQQTSCRNGCKLKKNIMR